MIVVGVDDVEGAVVVAVAVVVALAGSGGLYCFSCSVGPAGVVGVEFSIACGCWIGGRTSEADADRDWHRGLLFFLGEELGVMLIEVGVVGMELMAIQVAVPVVTGRLVRIGESIMGRRPPLRFWLRPWLWLWLWLRLRERREEIDFERGDVPCAACFESGVSQMAAG